MSATINSKKVRLTKISDFKKGQSVETKGEFDENPVRGKVVNHWGDSMEVLWNDCFELVLYKQETFLDDDKIYSWVDIADAPIIHSEVVYIAQSPEQYNELEAKVARLEKELFDVASAAVKYDDAIRGCANSPKKMASFCTAKGETLDELYYDWMSKSRNYIAKLKSDE